MLLKNLLPKNNQFTVSNLGLALDVSSIEIDSRMVQDNSIFFALKGGQTNGIKFIDSAMQKGAKVIIHDSQEDIQVAKDITVIKVDNPHELLVLMLKNFYPNLPKNIFAVTGTNGKTSVGEFCRQILESEGKKAAVIGTLGVSCSDLKVKESVVDSNLTTPDIVSLYKNLAILKEHDVDFVIIEASSIGLHQGRMDGINFKVAAFTNFTQDHLDYHGSMKEYFDAKMILFDKMLSDNNLAVINSDSANYNELKEVCQKNNLNIVSYGAKSSDFCIIDSKEGDDFREVTLSINGKEVNFNLSILENFQSINIVCALAIVVSYLQIEGLEIDALTNNLVNLSCVNGRMEKVATLKNNAKIYIDFAHTPDALESLLSITKKQAKARVLVVFGCGGDRDVKKRPIMGNIAASLSHLAIITDDNPRTEDSQKVRQDIIAGVQDKSKIIEIPDRKKAINKAVSLLKMDDILIVAGKGHEQYQIIGKQYLPFDEKEIIRNAIN